jgi:hypothetical protein
VTRGALRLLGCALLAGCAAPVDNAADPSAAFPARVEGFERVEVVPAGHGRLGVMAGYQSIGTPGGGDPVPVAATVHVHAPRAGDSMLPALDRMADPAAVAAADLVLSEAQVHRFYPQARVLREAAAFLVQGGAFRPGRRALIAFDEKRDGAVQPMQMAIYTFCCDRAGMLHEYRFRYAADAGPDLAIAAFMRALAW